MRPLFVTGTGTDVGKTIACVALANALQADYWKPVQAGFHDGTDEQTVRSLRTGGPATIHPEVYKLKLAASPHIAAREEGIVIEIEKIAASVPSTANHLLIEGAGGILVPLNDREFVSDLITRLHARVILVSRNYLGSINHSLLTAAYCKERQLDVAGWIFTDEPGGYEEEISAWSGYPVIAKIPRLPTITPEVMWQQALLMKQNVLSVIGKAGT